VSVLFEPPPRFCGLPEAAFRVFSIDDRDERRQAILSAFHPALRDLGADLCERLAPPGGDERPLNAHLPRLDWPRGYQPFCTWLALSRETHGYQAGPQLNVGVHADHVAARLAWDVGADGFGRFEFLCRRGHLSSELRELASAEGLLFRVYAAAAWPTGSRCVFESADDIDGSFGASNRRGVWWELGQRWELPAAGSIVHSPELGAEVLRIFRAALPVYDRITGS